MNLSKLKKAAEAFLARYPGGFGNPEIMSVRRKKHNVDKMIRFAQASFARINFRLPDQIVENMVKTVGRSSVLSVFEKTRFREFAESLFPEEKNLLGRGLEELLKRRKLAKWSLMTICQTYYHPQRDVLVKPTTVKGIIQYFELKDLQYEPMPSWEFYDTYRAAIHEMQSKVYGSLSPTNAAFSWFLLLSFRGNLV